ncbi:hypothetical protein DL98DRAFT_503731 [Cadophora sp. DSE1049]|nr:hypothetical protein DL98DRAFT_503731 [Cadophora sp. DSE1049]
MAGKESRWAYSPSLAVGAVTTGIFAILTIFHTVRLFKTRTWFCIPFIVGGIFESIGYGARAASNSNRESLPLYIMQALLILLAPILFAASVYMILGRLIRATGAESYAIIRVTRITKIFVGGDILCFLVQAMGAGMLSGADSKKGKDRGQKDGYLLQNEWPIYVFDALLMAIVLAVCCFWYVGTMRPRQNDIDLVSAESGTRTSRQK